MPIADRPLAVDKQPIADRPLAADKQPIAAGETRSARGFHALHVSEVAQLTDDAVRVAFEVPADLVKTFEFVPGQYLTLRHDIDGHDVRRPYSICSAAGESPAVGIRRVAHGRFSNFACTSIAPGDVLDVMPPQGRFASALSSDEHSAEWDVLLIAAGSGITPMMSIAASLLRQHNGSRVTLVYGNRSAKSIMFHDALDDLKNRFLDRFACLHLLSRETQDVALLNGRIDTDKLGALNACGAIAPATADHIFVCGPGEMIDTATQALISLGAPVERIQAERFEPADDGTATKAAPAPPSAAVSQAASDGVQVNVIIDGGRRQFRIEDASMSVLHAAAASGLELPFSCTGGMCATCRCKVLEGHVEMSSNYSLEPWELDAGFVLACQSRPTTRSLVLDFDAT